LFPVRRNLVHLDHGIVVVIEIEQVRGDSHAYGIALTAIVVDFNAHHNLLATTPLQPGIRIRRPEVDTTHARDLSKKEVADNLAARAASC
jgi:hypothetical protein